MKNLGIQYLRHSEIFPENSKEPVLTHNINGISVEVEVDGGNWWITDVKFEGNSYNVHDTPNPSNLENFSGNDKLGNLLEKGVDLPEALHQSGALWMVNIWDDTYAYIPEN